MPVPTCLRVVSKPPASFTWASAAAALGAGHVARSIVHRIMTLPRVRNWLGQKTITMAVAVGRKPVSNKRTTAREATQDIVESDGRWRVGVNWYRPQLF